jgi:hypothetical protein
VRLGPGGRATDIRRADPKARRQALLFVLLGAIVGAVLITGFELYRQPFREWLLAGQGGPGARMEGLLILTAALVAVPLGWFAAYLWKLGARVEAAAEYSPPGCQLLRDTPALCGNAAIARARALKSAALALLVAIGLLGLLFWRLFKAFGM